MVAFDAAADGRILRLAEEDSLRSVLPAGPGTGHRWRIAADAAPVLRRQAADACPSEAMRPAQQIAVTVEAGG
ncbi:hypothetical protein [Dankookia sp. P2]|uniref:hypothetical protein n=1 Tax=Dankookia sp. P2 TaxID=3423955 RepID=UPI003D66EF3D